MAIGTAIEITDKMTGPLNRITAAFIQHNGCVA